jgi:hypothetical protein
MTKDDVENIDPETGEILDRAQEGEVENPPPSFAHFFTTIHRGAANEEVSGELQKLVQALRDEAMGSGNVEKGSLTVKLDFAIEGELMMINYDVKRKDPKAKRARAVAFHTTDGALLPEDPRQGNLPLKVAGFAGPMKSA